MDRSDWTMLIKEAVRDPRANGRRIANWPMPDRALAEALVLVSALAILGVYGVLLLGGGPPEMRFPAPLVLTLVQIGVMLLLAGVMTVAGKVFDGTGSFRGALRIMVWLQALMVLLQLVQLVAVVVLPILAPMVSLLAMLAVGWIAAGLVAGLHGFRSVGLTFLGMIGTFIVLVLAISMVIAPFVPMPV